MTDIRRTDPNATGHRKARFHVGWNDAITVPAYTSSTLERLTWQNLGWRLGRTLGATSRGLIDEMYDWCVRQQADAGTTLEDD